MVYCFDIDGVICETVDLDYANARPVKSVVEKINELYDSGHTILIYTARGMGALKGNMANVYDTWYEITKNQLKEWGLRHHQLIFGKPNADIYIDDRAMNFNSWIKSYDRTKGKK